MLLTRVDTQRGQLAGSGPKEEGGCATATTVRPKLESLQLYQRRPQLTIIIIIAIYVDIWLYSVQCT